MKRVFDQPQSGRGSQAGRAVEVMPHPNAPKVSVVIPVYNEVENIVALHRSLTHALAPTHPRYELLIVDDGSSDGTRAALRRIVASDPHVRAIFFRRNAGQTQAMAAGFDHARGSTVVTMDGDLQNDPADIPRMIELLDEGYDIVCGWRRHRQDSYATRLVPSKIANWLIRRTTHVPIHDTGCSLKVYRSWVVRTLHLYSDMHRFIAALGAGLGARIAELPVRHHARRFGHSKYGLGRIFRVVADLLVIKMLIQFSAHPIRWFGLLSLPLVMLAFVFFMLGFVKFGGESWTLVTAWDSDYASAAAVSALVAFNVFLLGFLAELQLKASRFFRRRVSIAAHEASQ